MKHFWNILLAVLFVFSTLSASADQSEVLGRIMPCTIAIFPPDGGGGGSGVIVSEDGFALTNFHVVQPCGNWMLCGMADGRFCKAILVSIDPVGDVSLIKLMPPEGLSEEARQAFRFPTAVFGDSDRVRQGDSVWVLGNPFNYANDFSPTVTRGIVSGTHRYQFPAGTLLEYADCFQVDASVNPGNSGGPLFTDDGQLIGLNGRCSFEKRGRINVGVGFSISSNQLKLFLSHLRSGRILDHATLGATVEADEIGRPVVDAILESSDAAMRGLQIDDRLTHFGGRRVTTPNEFKNILGIFPKGWLVPIRFVRKTETGFENHEILVRLEGVHTDAGLQKLLKQDLDGDEKKKKDDPDAPAPSDTPEESTPSKETPEETPEGTPEGAPEETPDAPVQEGTVAHRAWTQDAPPAEERKLEIPIPGGDGKKLEIPIPGGDGKKLEIPIPPGMKKREKTEEEKLFQDIAKMPPELKPFFEAKPGWANYYFNRQEKKRVWSAFPQQKAVPSSLTGTLGSGAEFTLTVGDETVVMKLATNEITWKNDGDMTRLPEPAESGMVVPGLALWLKLQCASDTLLERFSYWGFSPIRFAVEGEAEPLYDVLTGNVGGVPVRLFFSRGEKPGRLTVLELESLDGGFPWEFRFLSANRLEIVRGDTVLEKITLPSIQKSDSP